MDKIQVIGLLEDLFKAYLWADEYVLEDERTMNAGLDRQRVDTHRRVREAFMKRIAEVKET